MDVKNLNQLKSRFVVRDMDNELILVPLTSNIARMNDMFILNEVAKFIWESMNEESTRDSLLVQILENFEVDNATAAHDLDNFLEKLEQLHHI